MTSYSDNAYDVTKFLVVLKISWPILYSYQVPLLSDNGRVKLGGFLSPPSIIGGRWFFTFNVLIFAERLPVNEVSNYLLTKMYATKFLFSETLSMYSEQISS